MTKVVVKDMTEISTSRMSKGNFSGTAYLNQRLLHCEMCHRLYNRDISASLNMGQIAERILVHGRHPWRPGPAGQD